MTVRARAHSHLMRPTNQIEIKFLAKLGHDVCTKLEPYTAIRLGPAEGDHVRVGPEQVS